MGCPIGRLWKSYRITSRVSLRRHEMGMSVSNKIKNKIRGKEVVKGC